MKRGRFEYISDGDDDDDVPRERVPKEREIYGYDLDDDEKITANILRPHRWYLNNIDADRWRAYAEQKIIDASLATLGNKLSSLRPQDLRPFLAEELYVKHPYFGYVTLKPEQPEYEKFKKVNKDHPFPYRLAAARGTTSNIISQWCILLNAYRTNNDIYFASLSEDDLTPDLFDTYDRIALSVEIEEEDDGHALLWLIDNEKEISYILDSGAIVKNIDELASGILHKLKRLKANNTINNRIISARIMDNLRVMAAHSYINLLGKDESRRLPIEFINVWYQHRPLYTGDCAVFVMWFMLWLFFHPTVSIPQPPPIPFHEPMAMRHFIVETLESGNLKIPKKMLSSLYYNGTERDPSEQIIERVNAYYDPTIGSGWKKKVRCKRACRKKKT